MMGRDASTATIFEAALAAKETSHVNKAPVERKTKSLRCPQRSTKNVGLHPAKRISQAVNACHTPVVLNGIRPICTASMTAPAIT